MKLYLVKWAGRPNSDNSWVSLGVIKENVEPANAYRAWLNLRRKQGTKDYKYMKEGDLYYLRMPLTEDELLQEQQDIRQGGLTKLKARGEQAREEREREELERLDREERERRDAEEREEREKERKDKEDMDYMFDFQDESGKDSDDNDSL